MTGWAWVMAAAMAFPAVQARDLNGQPADVSRLRGAPAVVAVGLSVDSQKDVEPWTTWLIAATEKKLAVIVMPVYGPMPDAIRGLVDRAAATRVPVELRRYVWTTTEREALVVGLGLQPGERSAMVLLDAAGKVQYVARGAPTEAAKKELLARWRAMKR